VAGRGPGTEEALPGLDYDRAAESVPQDVFGRICHAAVEAELDRDGRGATAFEEALVPVPEALREQIASEARILAVRFLESSLGDAARDAEELLLEKSFLYLTRRGDLHLGRTDLVYRTAKEVVVVDFKSDRRRRPGNTTDNWRLTARPAGGCTRDFPYAPLLFLVPFVRRRGTLRSPRGSQVPGGGGAAGGRTGIRGRGGQWRRIGSSGISRLLS
jgi:hypothetical protein